MLIGGDFREEWAALAIPKNPRRRCAPDRVRPTDTPVIRVPPQHDVSSRADVRHFIFSLIVVARPKGVRKTGACQEYEFISLACEASSKNDVCVRTCGCPMPFDISSPVKSLIVTLNYLKREIDKPVYYRVDPPPGEPRQGLGRASVREA